MSTYRGPRVKRMRALNCDLPGLSRKSKNRRPQPPGQHGDRRRRKDSDYGRQLKEKQKLRYNYGIGERQLRRLVTKAKSSKAETGKKIIELIEGGIGDGLNESQNFIEVEAEGREGVGGTGQFCC